MLSQDHKGAALFHYTGQVSPRFGDSGSLEEWKWCHNVIVEADIHFIPLHTSILDIYKVFESCVCCLKGIWLHPYTVALARLAPDLGTQGHFWSENDAITSWLRLISTYLRLQLFHASARTALQHQEVLHHHISIWHTNLPFLVKPLTEDQGSTNCTPRTCNCDDTLWVWSCWAYPYWYWPQALQVWQCYWDRLNIPNCIGWCADRQVALRLLHCRNLSCMGWSIALHPLMMALP